MDILTLLTGFCLTVLCVTTVECILWSYSVFVHCRWSIAHDVPDRRSISYEALSIFSGMTGFFCFLSWLIFAYVTSIGMTHILCLFFFTFVLFGFHIMTCHCWHLVSAFINIPLEFVPYTSRWIIIWSNKLFSHGYRVNSIPIASWEEFYHTARDHKSLIINFIEHSPDLFWTKDIVGRYTYLNKATADVLLESKRNDVLNKTPFDIKDDLKEKGIAFTFPEICVTSDEYTKTRRKPTLFYEYGNIGKKFLALRIMKAPIFDSKLEMVGIIGIGKDITKHIESYNNIEALFNEGKYEEAKSAFIAYKRMFESMRDVQDPDSLLKGII